DERGYGSVVAKFISQALAGSPITLHGDGSQTRCFTYVADTVAGTLLAARATDDAPRIFNLGTERETSVRDLAELVVALTGSSSPIETVSYESEYGEHFEDAPRRRPDASRARTMLGWEPRVTLEEGLERTLSWWMARD
ncbi:MAG TPA: GDP-mannose 4,6-dehydratase, partial [Acidimicrobiales bacterium]|nr:GDP-mannose 4,6-dehydratase [Acidimicrobiales bacterium]